MPKFVLWILGAWLVCGVIGSIMMLLHAVKERRSIPEPYKVSIVTYIWVFLLLTLLGMVTFGFMMFLFKSFRDDANELQQSF